MSQDNEQLIKIALAVLHLGNAAVAGGDVHTQIISHPLQALRIFASDALNLLSRVRTWRAIHSNSTKRSFGILSCPFSAPIRTAILKICSLIYAAQRQKDVFLLKLWGGRRATGEPVWKFDVPTSLHDEGGCAWMCWVSYDVSPGMLKKSLQGRRPS